MNNVNRWFKANKLSLNLNKTNFTLFRHRNKNINVNLNIDNVNIERVNEIKFLGVILDHKICWKPHIKYVQGKLARSIAVLGKTRQIFSQRALYILYYALILPHLSYCLEVWGNTLKSNLQTLIKMQTEPSDSLTKQDLETTQTDSF